MFGINLATWSVGAPPPPRGNPGSATNYVLEFSINVEMWGRLVFLKIRIISTTASNYGFVHFQYSPTEVYILPRITTHITQSWIKVGSHVAKINIASDRRCSLTMIWWIQNHRHTETWVSPFCVAHGIWKTILTFVLGYAFIILWILNFCFESTVLPMNHPPFLLWLLCHLSYSKLSTIQNNVLGPVYSLINP